MQSGYQYDQQGQRWPIQPSQQTQLGNQYGSQTGADASTYAHRTVPAQQTQRRNDYNYQTSPGASSYDQQPTSTQQSGYTSQSGGQAQQINNGDQGTDVAQHGIKPNEVLSGSYQAPQGVQRLSSASCSGQPGNFRLTATEAQTTHQRRPDITASPHLTGSVDPGEIYTHRDLHSQTNWHRPSQQSAGLNASSGSKQANVQSQGSAHDASPTSRAVGKPGAGQKRKRSGEHERRPTSSSQRLAATALGVANGVAAGPHRASDENSASLSQPAAQRDSTPTQGQSAPQSSTNGVNGTSQPATDGHRVPNGPNAQAKKSQASAFHRTQGPSGHVHLGTWEAQAHDLDLRAAPASDSELLTAEQVAALRGVSGILEGSEQTGLTWRQAPDGSAARRDPDAETAQQTSGAGAEAGEDEDDAANAEGQPASPTRGDPSGWEGWQRQTMHIPRKLPPRFVSALIMR